MPPPHSESSLGASPCLHLPLGSLWTCLDSLWATCSELARRLIRGDSRSHDTHQLALAAPSSRSEHPLKASSDPRIECGSVLNAVSVLPPQRESEGSPTQCHDGHHPCTTLPTPLQDFSSSSNSNAETNFHTRPRSATSTQDFFTSSLECGSVLKSKAKAYWQI